MRILNSILVLAVSMAVCGVVQAAPTEPIGAAIKIKNDVKAEFDSDRRPLTAGDNVHQNEIIAVGSSSLGELELDDDTKLALGPGSRLKLDKFVYNGEKTAGDIVVDLVQGTFRFITGVATKKSYRIRTPAASITVRGTIFDVYVADDGMMWILLMEGGIRACNDGGDCSDLDKPGMFIHVTANGIVSDPMVWASLPGRDLIGFNSAFPFVVSAPGFDTAKHLTRAAIVGGDKLPSVGEPKSTPKKKVYKRKYKKKKKYKKTKLTPTKKKVYKKKKIYKKKPVKKVYKKKKKKYKKKAKNNNGQKLLGAAIAVGVGIAIGKSLGKKKKKPKYPRHKQY